MSAGTYRHIFGPVPSRRLGYSLGVDLIPFKTCSYDCIYCQLGRTTHKTLERREYVPLAAVLEELERKLSEGVEVDYITMSGSGEPTLYSRLGELIRRIKDLTTVPVAVLTNASLLWDRAVQQDLEVADLVIPSLDAGTPELFRYVNRPCETLAFQKMADGLIEFCATCPGKIWLEVFLLGGVTAIEAEAANLNKIVAKIKPAKVQLNTVKRPPAESFALAVPARRMQELALCFEGNVEIIAEFDRKSEDGHAGNMKQEIANLLMRRPCCVNDIAGCLNLHPNEVVKYLEIMEKESALVSTRSGNTVYYSVKH